MTNQFQTVHYLQDTECKKQNAQSIQKFLEAMKKFKLTKTEKLMMVNTPPRTELEIQLVSYLLYCLLSNTESSAKSVKLSLLHILNIY